LWVYIAKFWGTCLKEASARGFSLGIKAMKLAIIEIELGYSGMVFIEIIIQMPYVNKDRIYLFT